MRVSYGHRPIPNVVDKGDFICPTCGRKRKYLRVKMQKRAFFGLFTLFSLGDIAEYVKCQGCLEAFNADVLEPGTQLKISLKSGELPPANIIDVWHKAYADLSCEALLAKKEDVVETISPILLGMAYAMQSAGVQLRLGNYQQARWHLVRILDAGLEWQDIGINYHRDLARETPKLHKKTMEYVAWSHQILSLLP